MCNELVTMRQNDEAEKKALMESRISHIAEKEMQRSLELALAESFEHNPSPSSRSSPLTVASDDGEVHSEIEEIDEDEDDEDDEDEEVHEWDFYYGIGCA
eukprot:2491867-Prymnesium_polylepis.1